MTDLIIATAFGYIMGSLVILAMFWRRISKPSLAEELRSQARAHQDEKDRLVEQLAECRRQVREQFARADRMAHLYAQAMDRKGTT